MQQLIWVNKNNKLFFKSIWEELIEAKKISGLEQGSNYRQRQLSVRTDLVLLNSINNWQVDGLSFNDGESIFIAQWFFQAALSTNA